LQYNHLLLAHVSDGDLHTVMDGVEFSTNLREIITVGDMVQQYEQLPEGR
jgi:hypothetical protein